MPRETTVTRCGNCGAALDRIPGQSALQCAYCRETTWLAPTAVQPEVPAPGPGPTGPLTLAQRLARGPSGNTFGAGTRHGPATPLGRAPQSADRGLWPTGARASSTFGGSWSPSAVLGPPRVYPRCGDIGGAWAPGPSNSPVEWIEVDFAPGVAVSAVRVFETNRPGSTFAVVDLTRGEELLFEAPPQVGSTAQVLEVAVDPPRPIQRVRVYVANSGWAEIDTVGLVAAAPLPLPMRTQPRPPSRGGGGWMVLAALGAVAALGVAVASLGDARRRTGASAARPRPAQSLPGATMVRSAVGADELASRSIVWATEVTGFSSEYSSTANAASSVRGAPDVYPLHGDVSRAWASQATDAGEEWIEVRFGAAVPAVEVLWAETFNAGAVVRVDDLSDPGAPVVLWEGPAAPVQGAAVIGEVLLPARRTISAVRLVLDSRRVAGWNEIDAIGLVTPP